MYIHIITVLDCSVRILTKKGLCCDTNISQLQMSSTAESPSTLNSTSTLLVVLRQLRYSRASQPPPTLRLQCTGIHNQLQDRTLQQSILLHANTELTTALFASNGLIALAESTIGSPQNGYAVYNHCHVTQSWSRLATESKNGLLHIAAQRNNELALLW
jgi:hypothetical protein